MRLHLSMLITDWLIYAIALITLIAFIYTCCVPHLRTPWKRMLQSRMGMIAATILGFYIVIGLADSLHFKVSYPNQTYRIPKIQSLLDIALTSIATNQERSYSAPFSTHAYTKSTIRLSDTMKKRAFIRLKQGGAHLKNGS